MAKTPAPAIGPFTAYEAPEIELPPCRPPLLPRRLFSIVIPTWNNLPYLKLCIQSIRKNSAHRHEILAHVNEGIDGTREWLESEGIPFTSSRENVGVCWAVNAAASLATTDHVLYLNDDMYVCPGWDEALRKTIESLGHARFFLSSTLIEPSGTNPCVAGIRDFGTDARSFREADLLAALPVGSRPDWSGASWPPYLMPRELWNRIGGFSVEFSPGAFCDPDLAMKLWNVGVREFRGVAASQVYHFQRKSTGRVALNPGHLQFAAKWGVTASWFNKDVLRMGRDYQGPLPEPDEDSLTARYTRLRAWVYGLAAPRPRLA
jgi:GT2 family glycosyltransferase